MWNNPDFEFTKLLPEINPFITDLDRGSIGLPYWFYNHKIEEYFIGDYYELTEVSSMGLHSVYSPVRDCWSWEDIRLYLFNQQIEWTVSDCTVSEKLLQVFEIYEKKYKYWVTFTFKIKESNTLVNYQSEEFYSSYEEARIQAIKHALTLRDSKKIPKIWLVLI